MSRIQEIHKILPIRAIGKPRQTQRDRWMSRPAVIRYRLYADELRELIGPVPPAAAVLSVDWIASFSMPRSWSKRERGRMLGQYHRSKPDRDNLDKAILDTLWKNDSGIAAGRISKIWSERDELEIRITYLAEESDLCPRIRRTECSTPN